MKSILVIIRGNSGSGKTYLADNLQKYYGYDTCLVLHQDLIRRELLHANDHEGTPAISMIENLIIYGMEHYQIIIVEGILREDVYGQMLQRMIKKYNSLVYYLDVPFELTLERDKQKVQSFGESKLKSWWREKDYLTNEDIILKENKGKILKWKDQIIEDIKKARA